MLRLARRARCTGHQFRRHSSPQSQSTRGAPGRCDFHCDEARRQLRGCGFYLPGRDNRTLHAAGESVNIYIGFPEGDSAACTNSCKIRLYSPSDQQLYPHIVLEIYPKKVCVRACVLCTHFSTAILGKPRKQWSCLALQQWLNTP